MNIVFVCTGNTCRSPMAEGFMKKIFAENNISGYVISRGLAVQPYSSVSEYSVISAMELGADIGSHIPKQLSVSDIKEADYVFCMTIAHKLHITEVVAGCSDKVFCISEFSESGDVDDPYGGNLEQYRCCARQLNEAVKNIFKKIVDRNGNQV